MSGSNTADQGNGSDNGRTQSDHDSLIDEVRFERDLDEVHLLLNFVSGRSDRSLQDLRVPDPDAPADSAAGQRFLAAGDVVRRISLIRFPPRGGQQEKAADAAFLLVAKDRLSALASPARAITIAFTELFVGALRRRRSVRRTAMLPGTARRADTASATPAGHSDDALFAGAALADSAFPGLGRHAARFRWSFISLLVFTILWFLVTSLTYWDVALGRSILQRIDQIHRDRAALFQANPPLTQESSCIQPEKEFQLSCWKRDDLKVAEERAQADLDEFVTCEDGVNCNRFAHVLRWGFVLCGVRPGGAMKTQQSVASVLAVASTYLLPMMFGILGTMISAFRGIQRKIKDSELSPRDMTMLFLALPMGLVAGVSVGLFFSPGEGPPNGTGQLAVNLVMTPAGLGFLAGYSAEGFFNLLDDMSKKVFRLSDDGRKT